MNTATTNNDPVLLEINQHIARITLNGEKKHNSLGRDEITLFSQYLEEVNSRQEVRVLMLTGTGERTFCAGAALDQLAAGDITPEMFAALTRSLATVRVPSICALNGSVYGGGCEVALSCDFRVGKQGIRAFVPAAKFGLCYPPSGIARLVTCLGLSNAQRFLLLAEEFNADELLQMGFLTQCVNEQCPIQAADIMAQSLASKAPLAVQAMKEISRQVAESKDDETRSIELVKQCADSADLAEGLLAAREKRNPAFTGA